MRTLRYLTGGACALILGGCLSFVSEPAGAPVSGTLRGTPTLLPAAGDTAVYRVVNAYNGESRGELHYRVEKADAALVIVSVTPSSPAEGLLHTEVYTPDGNWLRHPVINHDIPIEYDFRPPYPAYVFPLEVGKTWSLRVEATNPARRNNVRVDARVVAAERITIPAGSFDTFKIRRQVYAGDWDGFLNETNIREIEWYAPELGRPVRIERSSTWIDRSRTTGGGLFGSGFMEMRGDWTVYELVSHTRSP